MHSDINLLREPGIGVARCTASGGWHPGREATNLPVHSGACTPGSSNVGSLATISDAMYKQLVLHGGGKGERKMEIKTRTVGNKLPMLGRQAKRNLRCFKYLQSEVSLHVLKAIHEFKSIVTKANEECANEI
jgi:hypothetical protein